MYDYFKPETSIPDILPPGNNMYSGAPKTNTYLETDDKQADLNHSDLVSGDWTDEDGTPITLVDYNENPWVRIQTRHIPEGTTLNVSFHSSRGLVKSSLATISSQVDENGRVFFELDRNAVLANYNLSFNRIYFFVSSTINGELVQGYFPENPSEFLQISPIRYLPQTMRAQAEPMNVGADLMEHWFNHSTNQEAKKVSPYMDVSLDWVLGFKRANEHYMSMLEEQPWLSSPALGSLESQLNEMFEDGVLRLPAKFAKPGIGEEVDYSNPIYSLRDTVFGENSSRIINEDGDFLPAFHKYQFQKSAYGQPYFAPLDDLYAALANFNFMFTPFGEVQSLGGNEYLIKVTQLGVYIQDTFDFSGGQHLGCWDPVDQTVNYLTQPGCGAVTNGMFREWREKHGMGMDFRLFSNMEKIDIPYITFIASISDDGQLELTLHK
ncbi:MAG: hypothetical protein ACJASQ_000516 [Crocinitomicaceae bacterium]|jgi:hypothetical protein